MKEKKGKIKIKSTFSNSDNEEDRGKNIEREQIANRQRVGVEERKSVYTKE